MITRLRVLPPLFAVALSGVAQAQAATPAVMVPPAECQAHVGFDRDLTLPGYYIPTRLGPTTCLPFTVTAQRPPAKYKGDFYVDEFTDAKLRAQWAQCKLDTACFDKVQKIVSSRAPPNKEYRPRS